MVIRWNWIEEIVAADSFYFEGHRILAGVQSQELQYNIDMMSSTTLVLFSIVRMLLKLSNI